MDEQPCGFPLSNLAMVSPAAFDAPADFCRAAVALAFKRRRHG